MRKYCLGYIKNYTEIPTTLESRCHRHMGQTSGYISAHVQINIAQDKECINKTKQDKIQCAIYQGLLNVRTSPLPPTQQYFHFRTVL